MGNNRKIIKRMFSKIPGRYCGNCKFLKLDKTCKYFHQPTKYYYWCKNWKNR